MAPAADIRASDADRDRVVAALRRHCTAGRLTVDELEERLASAYAARTLGDLDALIADLPALPAPRAPAKPVRAGGPGLRTFHQRHELETSREAAFRRALDHVVPALVSFGYELVERRDGRALVFAVEERPAWVPLACVFAFPLGLLALLARQRTTVTVEFDDLPGGERAVLRVHGRARRPVRRAFAQLGQ